MKKIATKMLIDRAKTFIGVTEEGGDNRGRQVEIFQQAVDSKASRESWCMCFVQHCVIETMKKISATPEMVGKIKNILFKGEHVLTVWNNTEKKYRLTKPTVGAVVFWQYIKNGKATASGHCGIVESVSVDGKSFNSVEGNTGPGGAVVREGDGTYRKVRSAAGSPTMKIVGYIIPFDEQEKI